MEALLTYYSDKYPEAGLDEAGRGCLAGPVVAAAVIFPRGFHHPGIRDSKLMNRAQREEMELIIRKEAADFAIASISNEVIDEINILQASLRAMDEAVKQLKITPAFLLVDGNRFIRNYTIPYHCAVKGDNTFLSIAAASILAKTHRDRLMENLSQDYPHYDWATNKGYPTPGHKKAIREHGISPYHRQSFHMNEKSIQLKINF